MRKLLLLLPIALFCAGSGAIAQAREGQYPQRAVAKGGYLAQRDKAWPLIVFLHGSGERGNDIDKVKVHGPPKIVERQPDFPFITVSPLLPAEEDWDTEKLDAILDHVTRKLPVDRSRIYLTGLSRGGHASWRWAAAEPERFVAVMPVSGRGDPSQACKLKDMPVWAFHGDRDDIVTPLGRFAMVEAIRSCGGEPRLTIYPDTGHDAWTRTYDDPAL